ncbi:UPF0676 protein C1494.01-like [Amphibalanus amphitrite]|uniref:UPF0676 protein C1494.01-like n=1 Tax=Amphibalanus amphitrite TaxID=1232801 RepID=UPI001C915687|nr:UPF0676 protein C1494.01-like [Amphibalanus amphitrite]
MTTIRLVDIGKIGLGVPEPSRDDLLNVGRDIVDSFSSTGFAYLSNHGISQQLQDDTFAFAKGFFDLDTEQKLAYERFVRTGYTGYTPIAGDNSTNATDPAAGVTDLKECFDLRCLEDACPDGVAPQLGPQLRRIGTACRQLSERLLAALDAALGSGQLLTSCHRRQLQPGGWTVLRLLHYPAAGGAAAGRCQTRCGAHTDFSTLTLLFQHGVGGLEVEMSDGQWISAEPIPDTILINIGDVIELMTSGRLRATNHRVLLPTSEQARGTARQSMAFFVQPDQGTTVAPLDGDPRYQPIDFNSFIQDKFASVYPTYKESDWKC